MTDWREALLRSIECAHLVDAGITSEDMASHWFDLYGPSPATLAVFTVIEPLIAEREAAARQKERARVDELEAALERDRTRAADILQTITRTVVQPYSWLRSSRGSYEYDDDRWMEEFGRALDALDEALRPLAQLAADWSDCSRDLEAIKQARSRP